MDWISDIEFNEGRELKNRAVVVLTILVTTILFISSVIYVLAPISTQASENSNKQFMFTDEKITDTNLQYELSFKDLDNIVHYLYFNPNEDKCLSSGQSIAAFNSGSYYTFFNVCEGEINIGNRTCTIELDDVIIITNDFYLRKIN